MAFTVATFIAFTVLVAVLSWWKTRDDDLSTKEGYFLAGRGLPGDVYKRQVIVLNGIFLIDSLVTVVADYGQTISTAFTKPVPFYLVRCV